MSNMNNTALRDYSQYDDMNTEALRQLLREDSYQSEPGECDTDKIIYITQIIRGRENADYKELTERAWLSFNKNYKPYQSVISLYEDDEADELDMSDAPALEVVVNKRKNKPISRIAAAAAAVILILITGTITSYALGFNLWENVLSWTKETYSVIFGNPPTPDTRTEELRDTLREEGIKPGWAPVYLPKGYRQTQVQKNNAGGEVSVTASYERAESIIEIELIKADGNPTGRQYQKDEGEIESFEHNGIDYQIMTNNGLYTAVWNYDDIHGGIFGAETKDELIKMIESIVMPVPADKPAPDPVALLGLDKQGLLDALGLKKSQISKESDLSVIPYPGGYLYGEECDVRFSLDLDNNKVFSCRYEISTEGMTNQQIFELLKLFSEKLTSEYGYPRTYPGFGFTVSVIENADMLADAYDRWAVPGDWEYPGIAPEETFVQDELRYDSQSSMSGSGGSISVTFQFIQHVLSSFEQQHGIVL